MLKQFYRLFLALLVTAAIAGTALAAQAKKASPQVEKKTSGATASCDGALDIVPAKAMSFVRKRRPAKNDYKQQAQPADSKSQSKKTDDSKQNN